MQTLKFTLEGKSAFFKKPDVNTYLYFTYGHIHKVALLGIFGAILGYRGYNQMRRDMDTLKEKNDFPEFYSKLENLKIGIVPNNDKGVIDKKLNIFNNSIGYASQEKGGNLVVKEQWLENPSWDIYVLLDNEESIKIKDCISKSIFVYIPYLGKNDHSANISNISILDCIDINNISTIDSFFKKDDFKISNNYNNEFDDIDFWDDDSYKKVDFKYEEMLPIKLEKETNKYVLNSLVYTDMVVIKSNKNIIVFNVDSKIIQFF